MWITRRPHNKKLSALILSPLWVEWIRRDRQTYLVPNHQDDDENEHRGHYYPSDNDDHSPTEELRLHKMTPHVLWLGSELHAADHTCCCQRGDDIIVNSQYAEVILGPCCQVVDQEVLAWWGDHSVAKEREGEKGNIRRCSINTLEREQQQQQCTITRGIHFEFSLGCHVYVPAFLDFP